MYKLEIYGALCAAKSFAIKGTDADTDEFGEGSDESPDTAEDYACGNRRWRGRMPTSEVLTKYSITVEEYAIIVTDLENRLSFGLCVWCV
jgi:hypothetical protein